MEADSTNKTTRRARAKRDSGALQKSAPIRQPDLWELVWGQPYIDAARLAQAIEHDLQGVSAPDFRSRLLVRDAARAVRSFWGGKRFNVWLASSSAGESVRRILNEKLGKCGFPFIRRRLVASIDAVKIGRIFDLLGRVIHDRIEVNIAGSIPTLIKGLTARPAADIALVDEAPPEIRKQRGITKEIADEYRAAYLARAPAMPPTHDPART